MRNLSENCFNLSKHKAVPEQNSHLQNNVSVNIKTANFFYSEISFTWLHSFIVKDNFHFKVCKPLNRKRTANKSVTNASNFAFQTLDFNLDFMKPHSDKS